MFLGVETRYEWIKEVLEISFINILFFILLTLFPAVVLSMLIDYLIPVSKSYHVYEKTILIVLPLYNYFLWRKEIRIFIFFVPSWFLFGLFATFKAIINDYTY